MTFVLPVCDVHAFLMWLSPFPCVTFVFSLCDVHPYIVWHTCNPFPCVTITFPLCNIDPLCDIHPAFACDIDVWYLHFCFIGWRGVFTMVLLDPAPAWLAVRHWENPAISISLPRRCQGTRRADWRAEGNGLVTRCSMCICRVKRRHPSLQDIKTNCMERSWDTFGNNTESKRKKHQQQSTVQ